MAVAEQKVLDLEKQDASPDPVIPLVGIADRLVRACKKPPERLRAQLHDELDELHPGYHAQWCHVPGGEDLMFVIPLFLVELENLTVGGHAKKGVQRCGVTYITWI